jgi:uncharacterized membrane protein
MPILLAGGVRPRNTLDSTVVRNRLVPRETATIWSVRTWVALDRISSMTASRRRTYLIWACLLFGLGLGGLFDGIVLHQILQWHHMLSSEGSYPVTTVAGLEANTLGDGLFHAVTYVAVAAALWLLWKAGSGASGQWSARLLIGLLLVGWGTFNLVEGTIDHQLLQIHHVREDSANRAAWDIAFLGWGALMLVGGRILARSGDRQTIIGPENANVEVHGDSPKL